MTISSFGRAVGALALAVLASGCNLVGVECTTEVVPALVIEVVDSVTGDPLPSPLAWVRDGVFQDTLESSAGAAWGPYERGGTYEVHVEHQGYQSWMQSGVRVTEDQCHPRTRELFARLQPTGG